MTAAVNFPTLRLIRYSIGNINIEGYASGEHKIFDEQIIAQLLSR